jgi:hypothetical protein
MGLPLAITSTFTDCSGKFTFVQLSYKFKLTSEHDLERKEKGESSLFLAIARKKKWWYSVLLSHRHASKAFFYLSL